MDFRYTEVTLTFLTSDRMMSQERKNQKFGHLQDINDHLVLYIYPLHALIVQKRNRDWEKVRVCPNSVIEMYLGVTDILIILVVVMVSKCIYLSKLIQLYTLNMCSLVYVKCPSMKLSLKKE